MNFSGLIQQEAFKIVKRKDSRWLVSALLLLFLLMFILAYTQPQNFEPKYMLENCFSTLQWVPIIVIIIGATSIGSEFQSGAIKNLVSRSKYRFSIIGAKFVVLFGYSFCLYFALMLLTLIISFIFFPGIITKRAWTAMFLWISGSYIENIMILSLVVLLAIIFKSAAGAVSIGIIFYLFVNLLNGFLFDLIKKVNILKWNPFNMLNLKGELINASLEQSTQLSILQLFLAIISYVILFVLLSLSRAV
ncbi:MAG: ABC transporter permease [Liquorilactobacillus hordei]|uniref:ABC transporter permease n=1 Tax=Lactobacillaceae TaxID=33958 RepID=UPI0039E765FE